MRSRRNEFSSARVVQAFLLIYCRRSKMFFLLSGKSLRPDTARLRETCFVHTRKCKQTVIVASFKRMQHSNSPNFTANVRERYRKCIAYAVNALCALNFDWLTHEVLLQKGLFEEDVELINLKMPLGTWRNNFQLSR